MHREPQQLARIPSDGKLKAKAFAAAYRVPQPRPAEDVRTSRLVSRGQCSRSLPELVAVDANPVYQLAALLQRVGHRPSSSSEKDFANAIHYEWHCHASAPQSRLTVVRLRGCAKLGQLPISLLTASLATLDLTGCASLRELPFELASLSTIEHIILVGCSSLTRLLLPCPASSLSSLSLRGCCNLLAAEDGLLSFEGCARLSSLDVSECAGLARSLVRLCLSGCERLSSIPTGLAAMHALEELDLTRGTALYESMEPGVVSELGLLEAQELPRLRVIDCNGTGHQLISVLAYLEPLVQRVQSGMLEILPRFVWDSAMKTPAASTPQAAAILQNIVVVGSPLATEKRKLIEHDYAEADALFARLDTDKSGTLDCGELLKYLLSEGQEAETISELFGRLDANSDGVVTLAEWREGFLTDRSVTISPAMAPAPSPMAAAAPEQATAQAAEER
jgi:hypothetical protein